MKEDLRTFFELIEVRKAIETFSAYHAAKRATPEDIAKLEKSTEAMRVKIDQRINEVFAEVSGRMNLVTRDSLETLNQEVIRLRERIKQMENRGAPQNTGDIQPKP